MLVKDWKKGDVAVVKLSAREEVIGKVVSATAQNIELEKVLLIQPMQAPDGTIHLSFIPYSLTCEDTQTFKFFDYVAIFEPMTDVKTEFLSSTSGIKLPQSGLIT